MAFFEEELQKMFGKGSPVRGARFTGRACVGRLGETTNVKLRFVTQGTADHYGGLEATVFNRNEGKIDSNVFLFEDILGKKPGKSACHANGIPPHVWVCNGKIEWYACKPAAADYAAIAAAVNGYLETFLDPPERAGETERPSTLAAIREAKAKPRQPCSKSAPGRKKDDRGI
jgi:hypothetical protein